MPSAECTAYWGHVASRASQISSHLPVACVTFFRDPFRRGMALMWVLHALTVILLLDLIRRRPAPSQPPECAGLVVWLASMVLLLAATAKL